MRTRLSRLIPLLALLGCSDPLGPEDITGVYELAVFRGAEVPATVTEGDSTVLVMSGRVTLMERGMAAHDRSVRIDGSLATAISHRLLGYQLSGNEIRWFELPCPEGRTCPSLALPAPLMVIGDRLVSSAELGEEYVRSGDIP